MSQPKTIRTGFKSPPLDLLKGRGPPTGKKKTSFFLRICHKPQSYLIVYMDMDRQTTAKGLKKDFICRRGINKLLL